MSAPLIFQRPNLDSSFFKSFDVLPNGHIRIGTQLLYPDLDYVDVFIPTGQTSYPVQLVDFGATHENLLHLHPLKPHAQLTEELEGLGCVLKNGELQTQATTVADLPEKIRLLAQACVLMSHYYIFTSALVRESRPNKD